MVEAVNGLEDALKNTEQIKTKSSPDLVKRAEEFLISRLRYANSAHFPDLFAEFVAIEAKKIAKESFELGKNFDRSSYDCFEDWYKDNYEKH